MPQLTLELLRRKRRSQIRMGQRRMMLSRLHRPLMLINQMSQWTSLLTSSRTWPTRARSSWPLKARRRQSRKKLRRPTRKRRSRRRRPTRQKMQKLLTKVLRDKMTQKRLQKQQRATNSQLLPRE